MLCSGCGSALGATGSRVVPWADSPTGTPFYVCGACGHEMPSGTSVREVIGEVAPYASDDEPSGDWCDDVAENWTKDRARRT